MLTKTNFKIAKIVNKGGSILINDKYTVANDGRRLIEVSRPLISDNNMRDIDGFNETRKTDDIILDKKSSLSISKKITSENKSDLIPSKIARISNNGTLKIATVDKNFNPEVYQVVQDGGNYPKYKEVIPKNADAVAVVAINPEYLKDICDIMSKFQTEDNKRAYLHIYDNSIKMRTYNKETRQKCQAVIMNMNTDSTKDALPGSDKIKIDDMCDTINSARNKRQGDPGYICAHYTMSNRITIVIVLPEDVKECTDIIFKSNEFKKAKKYLDDIIAIVKN
jgi:hypothetical protein